MVLTQQHVRGKRDTTAHPVTRGVMASQWDRSCERLRDLEGEGWRGEMDEHEPERQRDEQARRETESKQRSEGSKQRSERVEGEAGQKKDKQTAEKRHLKPEHKEEK